MVTLNTGSQPKDLSHRIPRQPLAHLDVEDPEGWDAIQPHPATATPGMNMGGMEQSQKKKNQFPGVRGSKTQNESGQD